MGRQVGSTSAMMVKEENAALARPAVMPTTLTLVPDPEKPLQVEQVRALRTVIAPDKAAHTVRPIITVSHVVALTLRCAFCETLCHLLRNWEAVLHRAGYYTWVTEQQAQETKESDH